MSHVTTILDRLDSGEDPQAAEELLTLVYNELRIIARSQMSQERPGHTLQPTVLVNDAWLILFPGGKKQKFKNRAHFFGAAGEAMRRMLIDHARRRNALKRGKRTEVAEDKFAHIAAPAPDELMLAVDEALERFAETDKVTTRLIKLRFFVGLTMKEAAAALKIPLRSAERDFEYFAAWFRREYGKDMRT